MKCEGFKTDGSFRAGGPKHQGATEVEPRSLDVPISHTDDDAKHEATERIRRLADTSTPHQQTDHTNQSTKPRAQPRRRSIAMSHVGTEGPLERVRCPQGQTSLSPGTISGQIGDTQGTSTGRPSKAASVGVSDG